MINYKNDSMNHITELIYKLLSDKKRFLTLKEIYVYLENQIDKNMYKDYKAVIRKNIYLRCVDRDLQNKSYMPLFFSTDSKKTQGNKYGLLEWLYFCYKDDFNYYRIEDCLNNQ